MDSKRLAKEIRRYRSWYRQFLEKWMNLPEGVRLAEIWFTPAQERMLSAAVIGDVIKVPPDKRKVLVEHGIRQAFRKYFGAQIVWDAKKHKVVTAQ